MKPLGLIPLLALLLQTQILFAAAPSFERHTEFFFSEGRKIHVEIFAPLQEGRFPGVLVLHTAAGTLAGKSELELFCKQLASQGKVAFLVRYFERTGTQFAGDKKIGELSPLWIDTIRDGVSFAVSHPKVRPQAIGIFGYSLGAYLGIAESSRDPRIKAVVEVSGGILDRYKGKIRQLPPLLILHGNADQRVPVSSAFELQALASQLGGNPQIHIYEGEGHELSAVAGPDATARALRFLDRHLSRY